GIRDFHVTGVQTCALPISGGRCTTGPSPSGTPSGPPRYPARRLGASMGFLTDHVRRVREDLQRTPLDESALPGFPATGPWCSREIGRASCRERGGRRVGGG